MSATSSRFGGTGLGSRRRAESPIARTRPPRPAAPESGSMTATPSFSAARSAGDSLPALNDQRLRPEIFEVELELVLLIGGIERRRGRRGGHAKKRRRHFRPVRQHDRDAIAKADPKIVQRCGHAVRSARASLHRSAAASHARQWRPRRRAPLRRAPSRCDPHSWVTQLRTGSGGANDSPLPLRATVSPKSFVTA